MGCCKRNSRQRRLAAQRRADKAPKYQPPTLDPPLPLSESRRKEVQRSWTNIFRGEPCFVIGNGPSVNDIPNWQRLDRYLTIGINRIFKRYVPTVLLWQDTTMWQNHAEDIKPLLKTTALYTRRSARTADFRHPYIFVLDTAHGYRLPNDSNILHGGGSSGALGFQLAYLLGCNPIVIIGLDCRKRNGQTNFYGNNKYHGSHTLPNCLRALKWVRKAAAKKDRSIISLSDSELFPTQDFEHTLTQLERGWKGHPRHFYLDKLRGK